ncbi:hypothetical protein V1478_011322 [Vespula squamosa]|uniref:Uncharacterized protein n=1 Tax=Vespula squamosa TaxID=30214 RepID=A0ABD2AE71_VESSQ
MNDYFPFRSAIPLTSFRDEKKRSTTRLHSLSMLSFNRIGNYSTPGQRTSECFSKDFSNKILERCSEAEQPPLQWHNISELRGGRNDRKRLDKVDNLEMIEDNLDVNLNPRPIKFPSKQLGPNIYGHVWSKMLSFLVLPELSDENIVSIRRGEGKIVVKVVQRSDKERNPMRVPDKWLMPLVWGTPMFPSWVLEVWPRCPAVRRNEGLYPFLRTTCQPLACHFLNVAFLAHREKAMGGPTCPWEPAEQSLRGPCAHDQHPRGYTHLTNLLPPPTLETSPLPSQTFFLYFAIIPYPSLLYRNLFFFATPWCRLPFLLIDSREFVEISSDIKGEK